MEIDLFNIENSATASRASQANDSNKIRRLSMAAHRPKMRARGCWPGQLPGPNGKEDDIVDA